MKYSAASIEPDVRHPLAGEGGVTSPLRTERDPFEVLDDLMVVVEALCSQWPRRETFKTDGPFRI